MAAITMPVLVADWQKRATSAQIKKVYSTFSNALRRASADNGEWYYVDSDIGTKEELKEFVETYLLPYLNVGQVCEYGKDDVCNYEYSSKTKYCKWCPSNVPFYQLDNYYAFALADGSTYRVFAGGKTFKNGKGYLGIVVDINGNKKPNKMSRDLFGFDIYPTSYGTLEFLPTGYRSYSKQNREYLINLCKSYSSSCSNLLMNDGWEIKEDYPW